MEIGAAIQFSQTEFARLRDPAGIAAHRLAPLVQREMAHSFPDGCRVEAGTFEQRPNACMIDITIRLEVVAGEGQPDTDTLREGLRKMLLSASLVIPCHPDLATLGITP